MLLALCLSVGLAVPTAAAVTGALEGAVVDALSGKPVAGAQITAASPSQIAVTTSDASGHFTFVSLSPDTYVISGEAVSYDPFEVDGVSVISGRSVTVALKAPPSKAGPPVPAPVPVELVKPGSTAGASVVSSAQQNAVRTLGGGVNANNAYSGIASVPGAVVPFGGAGPNQPVYTKGSLPGQVAYLQGGVPVNRAYDNAPSNTLSTLGQQALAVQNAAVNANSPASGLAGVIEQTLRTGTDPGYANLTLGVGSPSFYHDALFELGGTNASRTFSYYAGFQGYNSSLRPFDQFNGGDGGLGAGVNLNGNPTNVPTAYAGGVYPACLPGANGPVNPFGLSPGQPGYIAPGSGGNQGCLNVNQIPNNLGALATIADREGLFNLHFAIPRLNGLKDDLQVLYDVSFVNRQYYDSLNDYTPNTLAQYLAPYYPLFGGSAPTVNYANGYTLGNVPFGALGSKVSAQPYYFPSTNSALGFNAPIPADQQDGQNSNYALLKLQFQHTFAPNLYARAYYYTLYSDLLTSGPVYAGLNASTFGFGALTQPVLPDYELNSHTQGGSFQLGWQLNSQNLVTLAANLASANVWSLNNGTFQSGLGTQATSLTDGINCYDVHTGALESCFALSGSGVPLSGGTIGSPIPAAGGVPIPIIGAAAKAGAEYLTTFNGYTGTLNAVKPQFLTASLSDDLHPNGKLDINFGIRFEEYQYDLALSTGPGYAFWFNQAANTFCYNLVTKQPLFAPPVKGQPLVAPVLEQGFNNTCGVAAGTGQSSPTGRVDPATGDPVGNPNGLTYNGYTTALFTNVSPANTTADVFEPRIGATYAVSADTLVSGSAGEYAQPFNSGAAQYLDLSPKSAAAYDFAYFWGQGYTSPAHIFSPPTSYNFDLSIQHHIKNTDASFTFAPFYRYAKNVFQDSPAGTGMTASIPTGNETAYGFNVQLRKGDPVRNGFSGLLNYAYTNAYFKFNPLPNGLTLGDGLNIAVDQYNALTAAGNREGQKGAPCYVGGVAASSTFCVVGQSGQPQLTQAGAAYTDPEGNRVVVNPYYDQPAQGYFNPTGPYPVFGLFPGENDALGGTSDALSSVNPHVFSGFLNYRRDRFSVTPTFQLQSGSNGPSGGARYGSPFSTIGVDPRSCSGNQTAVPTAPNPGLPNYITCGASPAQYGVLYIPDPYTGRFDGPGDFAQPWYFDFNAQFTYNLTPSTRATLILANIYQTCFGGTKAPWATAYPAQAQSCGYNANPSQVSNFYNGSSPRDTAANGVVPIGQSLYPYQPYSNTVYPFQMGLQLQFKL